jgi:hypothetical protein
LVGNKTDQRRAAEKADEPQAFSGRNLARGARHGVLVEHTKVADERLQPTPVARR